jgi:hypothetical protein
MPVGRIERIVSGTILGKVETDSDGSYNCFAEGSNMHPSKFSSLDDVADFLSKNPRGGVRMNPGWGKIVENIFIDGLPR